MYCRHCDSDDDNNCPACNCECSVGWFKDSQREALSALAQSKKIGIVPNERPQTTSDNVSSFTNALLSSLQNGRRDLVHTGMPVTSDAVHGRAANHLANYEPTMNEIHDVGKEMGKPTTKLPCGNDVSYYQKLPVRDRRLSNRSLPTIDEESTSCVPLPSKKSTSFVSKPQKQKSSAEQKDCFQARVTQQAVNKITTHPSSTNVRRTKRVLDGLAKSDSSAKMICDSYVTSSATGVPSPGMSQKALGVMHTLNDTPSTTPATTPGTTPSTTPAKWKS